MTKPLTPKELHEVLEPNPWWWGPDAYPAGAFFGMRVVVDPEAPKSRMLIVNDDGVCIGQIIDIED